MKINYTAPKVMGREMEVEDVIPTEKKTRPLHKGEQFVI